MFSQMPLSGHQRAKSDQSASPVSGGRGGEGEERRGKEERVREGRERDRERKREGRRMRERERERERERVHIASSQMSSCYYSLTLVPTTSTTFFPSFGIVRG